MDGLGNQLDTGHESEDVADVVPKKSDQEQPSDHLPLLAVFELGDEQGPASDAAKSRV